MATSYLAGILGLLGHRPVVPEPPKVSPQEAQRTATKGNIVALPDIEKLAAEADRFSATELLNQLERISPGLSAQLAKIPGIISDQLEGKVPDDVLRQIKQSVGAQAFQAGLSPGQRASLSAEAIGSTSYKIQQEGVSSAERWMAQISETVPRFNFAGMFITPSQQIAADQWNEAMRFNAQWLRNRVDAMPSPTEAAAAGFFNAFATLGESYISGGGMMGGFGGMGGAASGASGAGSASMGFGSVGGDIGNLGQGSNFWNAGA